MSDLNKIVLKCTPSLFETSLMKDMMSLGVIYLVNEDGFHIDVLGV